MSVRTGGWRQKIAWWWSGRREAVALRLAPWLRPEPIRGDLGWLRDHWDDPSLTEQFYREAP